MEPAAFLAALADGTAPAGAECGVPLATTPKGVAITLPVKLLARPRGGLAGLPLVVNFAGSIDQAVRGFPHYGGGVPKRADAVVLAVADPSLWLAPKLRTAWYQPNRHADVPRAIEDLVAAAAAALGTRRLVLVGNSNGAHAALVQGVRFPGSVAIALNPVARISAFHPHRVAHYLKTCWGRDATLGNLPRTVTEDCGALYRAGHGHTVILLANATDPHLTRQAVPFAARVRDQERLLLLTQFFPGAIGHTLPGHLRSDWIAAAVLAPGADRLDIARTHAELFGGRPARRPEPAPEPAPERAAGAASERDLDLAARLAATARET